MAECSGESGIVGAHSPFVAATEANILGMYKFGANYPGLGSHVPMRRRELYRKLGFAIVGTLPKAFRHQQLGLLDAYGRRIK